MSYEKWLDIRKSVPEEVEICIVTKYKPLNAMVRLFKDILHEHPGSSVLFGENYQTEIIDKIAALNAAIQRVSWKRATDGSAPRGSSTPELLDAEACRTDRASPESGPDQPGPDQSGPDQSGPDQSGPDQSGRDQSGQEDLDNMIDQLLGLDSNFMDKFRISIIGHLQRNKLSKMFREDERFRFIQRIESLDSKRTADALQSELGRGNTGTRMIEVFIQVNISNEPQKSGIHPADVEMLGAYIDAECPCLDWRGLMCIASQNDPEKDFMAMKVLRDKLSVNRRNYHLKLSMGMSADQHVAIKYETDEIRIGTSIMGSR
ncbi:amine-terminal domain alanine racemase [Gregarina niphandrodes]|uniref:Amine-terminal domain alanine racemase n=1 Tax=Gregarina niphandrodes TaxID=110365 RepID=A0A023B254_GRENI|nr:amine-terminal domain alanine racemase [Gregarina niphandrodes]EZG48435.1 amine-terminal domain alanine racemase [Gregarina niphandrodes]|eukprot:XP_011132096.1 amine-terminal domain alanine racemase [Gregarina niphandrodes]